AALALALLPAAQAGATILTASQSVTITGKYLPDPIPNPNAPDPRVDFSDRYNGSSLGASTFDFSSNPGIDDGSVFWFSTIDPDGFVRTASDLRLNHSFGGEDFTDLKVEVNSTVSYADTITTNDPNGAFFRFQTRLTGNLFNQVTYDNPQAGGASRAVYQTDASFSSRIANTGGDADETFKVRETDSTLPRPGIFGSNVDESKLLIADILFEDLLFRGSAIFFGWDYSDNFLIDIAGIDIGSIDILMQNELRQTIVTTASVYDANGVLLPDARVISTESGYVYAPIGGSVEPPNPVPVPSSALLLLLGCLALSLRRLRAPAA
ncbi:MAG: PEP-CTERM sorting domain-containing protein, partial [Halioglobus sp.]|nr:PEP-CTERM sorting domain-containing protein [Halioglobus sp.]